MLSSTPKKRAVAYHRHSAEDKQENSVPIQREHANKFAQQEKIEIIHEEADEGETGLLANRPGFERLFNDWILNPNAPQFDYVLVYDVSRWGRFQDQDEAAYYEFRCKQNGKKVIYVSRGMPKEEQQLISHLQTSIERYMAAEYSRQLSEKVFYGCMKVSEQGYSAGGIACYGMARLLLDANKKPIRILRRGEQKVISNERVTFTPLNDETTVAVKEMFDRLVHDWSDPTKIARALNEKGITSANGGQWNREKVVRILMNETYTGTRIYNKTWGRLKQKNRKNPRNEWVITPNAFPAIVPPNLFAEAQEHLYWLMPSKWKRGMNLINRMKKLLYAEVAALLSDNGRTAEESELIVQELPIVFGIQFYLEGSPHWCFLIEENLRNYNAVLAVSIALDQKDPVAGFFSIPTDHFGVGNFVIFSSEDENHSAYYLKREDVQNKILSFIPN